MAGPLSGLRIIEMGGIGPGPLAGMMLADHGAEVIRVERRDSEHGPWDTMLRSRKVVKLDLKNADDVAALHEMVGSADAFFEGFRPGTMERLGLGPDTLCSLHPKLVYARMTGWGQTGPYAPYAGHDLNYISLSGAAHAVGPAERPSPPLALVGDLGGGGMMLAFSLVAALLHAQRTGEGQVIDCAMTEGSALLMTAFYELYDADAWSDNRAANVLDGGAHYYNCYKTSDEKFVSVGPLEPEFYALFLNKLGLADDTEFAEQNSQAAWPRLKERLDAVFATKTRAEWCSIFEYSDACFAPVMSMSEAPDHPHSVARQAFVDVGGQIQPAPAPRYSKTVLDPPRVLALVEAADLVKV
jgi:alpha-methylacyl-CoA racemase